MIHPGDILIKKITECGISQIQLATAIDAPQSRIHKRISHERGVTASTAIRLGKYFGMEALYWLIAQTEYNLADLEHRGKRAVIEGMVRVP